MRTNYQLCTVFCTEQEQNSKLRTTLIGLGFSCECTFLIPSKTKIVFLSDTLTVVHPKRLSWFWKKSTVGECIWIWRNFLDFFCREFIKSLEMKNWEAFQLFEAPFIFVKNFFQKIVNKLIEKKPQLGQWQLAL